jgi:CrcB protein
LKEAVLIFLGGGLGSLLRFISGTWVQSLHKINFPFGTLAANILACFVLGFVVGLTNEKVISNPSVRLFWATGFCGGFSTFSAFSSETLTLMQSGMTLSAVGYVVISLTTCFLATYLGLCLSHQI